MFNAIRLRTQSTSGAPPLEENVRYATKAVAKPVTNLQVSKVPRRALGDISSTGVIASNKPSILGKPYNQTQSTSGAHENVEVLSTKTQEISEMDIDYVDRDDANAVPEYAVEIYRSFRMNERMYPSLYGYMKSQPDINEKMRSILIDWLIEVHLKFKLMPETMYLTVNLIDRFLEKTPISRRNLQLVGVTAMLLASKYEEIFAPEVRDFVYITDQAYTKEQILRMEAAMLTAVDFKLSVPTSYMFINRYLKAADADTKTKLFATFLLEITLQESDMLRYPASQIAAGCVFTALCTLRGLDCWTKKLEYHTEYSRSEVLSVALRLQEYVFNRQNSNLRAVLKKYALPKFGEVASIPLVRLHREYPSATEGSSADHS